MLVLTRRAGESIMIDNDIELKVLKIRAARSIWASTPKRAAVHRKKCGCAFKTNADPEPPQFPATNE
jgi:carbon storage regulator CsrA